MIIKLVKVGSNALVEVKDLTGDEVLDYSGECHSKRDAAPECGVAPERTTSFKNRHVRIREI